MIDDCQAVVWVAPHAGHSPGLTDEGSGGQNHGGRTQQLSLHCVVHTARGAGPSFGSGMDCHIALGGELLQRCRASWPLVAALVVFHGAFNVVQLFHDRGDHTQQLFRVRFVVGQQAPGLSVQSMRSGRQERRTVIVLIPWIQGYQNLLKVCHIPVSSLPRSF